jgi:23S rRNA (cytosine1962-C5)-methyltransferase
MHESGRIEQPRLLPKEERRLLRGHLWAYRNEFAEIPELDDGEIVDVLSAEGRFVGRGFYQSHGGIAVRILAWHQTDITPAFFASRIETARAFRETLFPAETTYRWIFGESDGLPGLVADRYGSVVAVQTSCPFYRSHIDSMSASLLAHEGVEGVRAEVCGETLRYGAVPEKTDCAVDGLRVRVDIEGGQKTGLFLDQRMNWPAVRRYAHGKRVLDGHCYAGLWSIHAALAGASHVTAADTSGLAIACAKVNADLNGVLERCSFERMDIMAALEGEGRYDLIVLDPPALAKSRAQERKALGLYQTLNTAALKALDPGGVLITSSCSHFVTAEGFLEILKRATAAARRQTWLLEVRGASLDHPVLMAMPETAYLKCVTLRVC